MHRPGTKTLRALLLAIVLTLAALMLPASSSVAQPANGNAQTPTLEQLFPKTGLLGALATQVAFSHDGKYLVTGLLDGTIRFRRAATNVQVAGRN